MSSPPNIGRVTTRERATEPPRWWLDLLAPYLPVCDMIDFRMSAGSTAREEVGKDAVVSAAFEAVPGLVRLIQDEITQYVIAVEDERDVLRDELASAKLQLARLSKGR